jgi:hypothetical protein
MTALVALLPVDKSTIFKSEVSFSCKLIAAVRSKTVAESFEYKTDQHKSSFEGRFTEIAAGQGFLRNELFVPYIVTQPR